MSDCRKCVEFSWCLENEDCGLFKQKPQTNADRIRAMTDEELAELIGDTIDCGSCKDMANHDVCPVSADNERNCHKYWLDWLKQKATEE